MRNYNQKRFSLTDQEIKRNQFEMFIVGLFMSVMLVVIIFFSF